MFAGLLVFQWLAGSSSLCLVSPQNLDWDDGVTLTRMFGKPGQCSVKGAIISLPVFLALTQPGTVLTRHLMAIAQMLYGGLLIHLTGGRIETHFHVFGSLAFLTFCHVTSRGLVIWVRIIVAADHLVGGVFVACVNLWLRRIPGRIWQSTVGTVGIGFIFEDFFLVPSCIKKCSRNARDQ